MARGSQLSRIDAKSFAKKLSGIEAARKANSKRPEVLLGSSCKEPYKKALYDYINAYRTASATKESLAIRQEYLEKVIGK